MIQKIKFEGRSRYHHSRENTITTTILYWNRVIRILRLVHYASDDMNSDFGNWLYENYGIQLTLDENRFDNIIGVRIEDKDLTMLMLRYPRLDSEQSIRDEDFE